MAYVAVKGGMAAILAAERLVQSGLAPEGVSPLEIEQILTQQRPLVDQVMGEGGLYAPELAALAVRQAEGDPMEAAFLLRAYRSTLSRIGYTLPADPMCMDVRRRISPAFKDVPGGQVLGRTRDYTQHLLDFSLLHTPGGGAIESDAEPTDEATAVSRPPSPGCPRGYARQGYFRRSIWQRLPKSHSTSHATPSRIPFRARHACRRSPVARQAPWSHSPILRCATAGLTISRPSSALATCRFISCTRLPATACVPGCITMTEVEMVVEPSGTTHGEAGSLSLAYGLVFGQNERKAIAMSILDGALSQDSNRLAVNDPEFVLYHVDGIESQGFVEHLKLPHHVTFQASLDRLRYLQQLYATPAEDSDAHHR